MFYKIFLIVSVCNFLVCSNIDKEDINIKPIDHIDMQFDGHHNHWGAERLFIEGRRDSLSGSSLVHNVSTSMASQRIDRNIDNKS